MKKTLITILTAALIFSGCNTAPDTTPDATPTAPDTPQQPETTEQTTNSTTQTYTNTELGLSFQYPATWDVWENDYKGAYLLMMKFKDETGEINNDLVLLKELNQKNFRTCDDILKNGHNSDEFIPETCETLTIDNQPVTVSTYKGIPMSPYNHIKEAQISTKGGIYSFTANTEEMFDHYFEILNSFKFSN